MKRVLDNMFRPNSIAVVGASDRETSVGYILFRNLLHNNYSGKIYPVNLRHYKVQGHKSFRKLQQIRAPLDLVIIATPWNTISEVLADCNEVKVKSVIVITVPEISGQSEESSSLGLIKRLALQYGIRILGSGSLGIANPTINLNATIVDHPILPGNLAFITHNGAIGKSIIYWAKRHHLGFKYFVSTGTMDDLSVHDLIDYFGTDPEVKCILIYLEKIPNPKQFISAARAFSRDKPIIVLKSGSTKIDTTDLPFSDKSQLNRLFYQTVFRRAGIIQVDSIAQLFYTAKAMAIQPIPKGKRLGIITNADGISILAAEYLFKKGGSLIQIEDVIGHTSNTLVSTRWFQNTQREELAKKISMNYEKAITAFLHFQNLDGLLVMYIPQASQEAKYVVEAIVNATAGTDKTVICCCHGDSELEESVHYLEKNQIPNYIFPERAVDVFLKMAQYAEEIDLLYETPPSLVKDFSPDVERVNQKLGRYLVSGNYTLGLPEMTTILESYNIPFGPFKIIQPESELHPDYIDFSFPWSMKVNGVSITPDDTLEEFGIDTFDAAKSSISKLTARIKKFLPDQNAEIIVQPQSSTIHEFSLIGFYHPQLGPFVLFGGSGISTDVYADWSVEIPPLNANLAFNLFKRTQSFQTIKNAQQQGALDLTSFQTLIIRLSYFVSNHSQLAFVKTKIGITPKGKIMVTEAYAKLSKVPTIGHLITPYPAEWKRNTVLKNRKKIMIRPIRPEDEPLEANMVDYLSKETIYFRFFGYPPKLSHQFLSRLTHIDYDREMAFVAILNEKNTKKMIGVVRLIAEPLENQAEYAIIVADPWQNQGLGSSLTNLILEYASSKDYKYIFCTVLKTNEDMIRLLHKKGFQFKDEDSISLYAWIDL